MSSQAFKETPSYYERVQKLSRTFLPNVRKIASITPQQLESIRSRDLPGFKASKTGEFPRGPEMDRKLKEEVERKKMEFNEQMEKRQILKDIAKNLKEESEDDNRRSMLAERKATEDELLRKKLQHLAKIKQERESRKKAEREEKEVEQKMEELFGEENPFGEKEVTTRDWKSLVESQKSDNLTHIEPMGGGGQDNADDADINKILFESMFVGSSKRKPHVPDTVTPEEVDRMMKRHRPSSPGPSLPRPSTTASFLRRETDRKKSYLAPQHQPRVPKVVQRTIPQSEVELLIEKEKQARRNEKRSKKELKTAPRRPPVSVRGKPSSKSRKSRGEAPPDVYNGPDPKYMPVGFSLTGPNVKPLTRPSSPRTLRPSSPRTLPRPSSPRTLPSSPPSLSLTPDELALYNAITNR
jgi:hypothetical protein